MGDGLVRIEGGEGRFAFQAPAYGGGRFETAGFLAGSERGYVLLARDRWCGAPVVVHGHWWTAASLDPAGAWAELEGAGGRRRSALGAASVMRQVALVCPAVPAVIDVCFDPSPTRIGAGQAADSFSRGGEDLDLEPFLVQEFVGDPAGPTSVSLRRLLAEEGPLDPADLLGLAETTAAALAAMHRPRQAGEGRVAYWAHGGLGTDAVLVMPPPRRFFLVGLDAACEVPGDGSSVRPAESTPEYGPPRDDEPVTDRFDVHCLGAVLFEAATGVPFRNVRDLGDVRPAAVSRELATAGVHPVLAGAITAAVAPAPAARPPAARVLRDVRAARAGRARDEAIGVRP